MADRVGRRSNTHLAGTMDSERPSSSPPSCCHGPTALCRFVQRLVEPADARVAVICVFALGIGVMHDSHEARSGMGGSALQHLQIAIRISERENRVTPDETIDADRLARTI